MLHVAALPLNSTPTRPPSPQAASLDKGMALRRGMLQQDVILEVHGAFTQRASALALQPCINALHVEGVAAASEDFGVICKQASRQAKKQHEQGTRQQCQCCRCKTAVYKAAGRQRHAHL